MPTISCGGAKHPLFPGGQIQSGLSKVQVQVLQSALHSSPSNRLPSSHASSTALMPSPQILGTKGKYTKAIHGEYQSKSVIAALIYMMNAEYVCVCV